MKKKLLVVLLIIISMATGCSVKKVEDLSPEEKFAKEYSVSKDNSFKYISIDEVLDIFKSGSGIVFFGNSDNEESTETVKLFMESILESKHSDIVVYYYNPVVIRDNDTSKYNELVDLLGDNLSKNSDDNSYLYLPDIYFVKDGKILGHNNEVAISKKEEDNNTQEEYRNKLKEKYIKLLNDYSEDTNN